jgi:hypothetical protein
MTLKIEQLDLGGQFSSPPLWITGPGTPIFCQRNKFTISVYNVSRLYFSRPRHWEKIRAITHFYLGTLANSRADPYLNGAGGCFFPGKC